jgi:hypothetical protein
MHFVWRVGSTILCPFEKKEDATKLYHHHHHHVVQCTSSTLEKQMELSSWALLSEHAKSEEA